MKPVIIRYCFSFADGYQEVFDLHIDAQRIELIGDDPDSLPLWTELDFHKCPNCLLTKRTHTHCPLAVHLVKIVNRFDGLLSYDSVRIDVYTEERVISQDTTVQRGIGSLMGLIMATSGCPHTAFFKPMARFHLPLASTEETVYRATSMYLLAQYFLKKKRRIADLELQGLKQIYRDIQVVNTSIVERLRRATGTDSSLNAIILLDIYSKALPLAIEESLKAIRYLFAPFFKRKEKGGRQSAKQRGTSQHLSSSSIFLIENSRE